MTHKFALHDKCILKRRKLHDSYSVSLYVDWFNMEDGFGQISNEDSTSAFSISAHAHRISLPTKVDKWRRKMNH